MMQDDLILPNYVIDTNCFISGINEIYSPDIFPSLWENIDGMISNHEILLIQEVIKELEQKMDSPPQWILPHKSMHKKFSGNQNIIQNVENKFAQLKITFTSNKTKDVDLRIIAWAKTMGATVITQEKAGGGGHKIPTICNEPDVNVKCISLAGLMSEKGWKFK